MANIDCTLNALKVPGFSGYTPPFGTKVTGSITPRDNNNNVLMPFGFQRPKVVTETSTTTQIQANIVFEIVAGGIVLTLGNAAFTGCRVTVINSANTDATVKIAATSSVSIPARAHESVHFEWVNGTWAVVNERSEFVDMITYALDSAGLANRETQKTIKQRIQTGVVTLKNRGIIRGCTVSKSTGAVRNLNLSTGAVFMNGTEMSCPAFTNVALVPSNNGASSLTCYAYIYLDANGMIKFACTALGGSVPEDGMALYRLTVPAANTETSDPNLASVTLSDVRRVEAGYPMQFNSLAYASVALPFNMLDTEYQVTTELLELKGGSNQRQTVYPGDKAANGFKIYTDGTLDMVKVRWTAIKTSL